MSKTIRLGDLLADVSLPPGAAEVEVCGLAVDSRVVEPGFLFAAIPGVQLDGRRFISAAVESGAVAILTLSGSPKPEGIDVPFVYTDNPRLALAKASAAYFELQPQTIAAVTGTSGKTSIATFTRQIWTILGFKAANIGTTGAIGSSGERLDEGAALTTPDAIRLHRFLSDLAKTGYENVAFEASSHGLDQFRLDGVRIKAAAFSNLSRDHMDYHATEEDYFAAKMRLFTEVMPHTGIAVINSDSDHGLRAVELAKAAGRQVWQVGRSGSEIRFIDVQLTANGQRLKLEILGKQFDVELPLAGVFQASNAALAAGLVLGCGGQVDPVVDALTRLEGVPGRLQFIGQANGGGVYVDYAHKPDALKTVLEAIRPHTVGKLHVLIGCGGDRDAGKRPLMGAIATELADRTIITDDNPRSEEPAVIRGQMIGGIRAGANFAEIGDRAEAIREGIKGLQAGDVLIVAGKGHETGQIIGDRVLPFDDAAIAKDVLDEIAKVGDV